MRFCDWLRASGHRYNGLKTRELYALWKVDN